MFRRPSNLISQKLYKFVYSIKVLPNTQFGFRKGLSITDAFLLLTHDLQSSLDKFVESRIVSLDFSSAFDLVNYQCLLHKLKSMRLGGSVFNIYKKKFNEGRGVLGWLIVFLIYTIGTDG